MVLSHFKGVIKIANLAQVVEELVDTGLVVLNEWVQCDHVRFLCVRRLVGQILEHLCDLQPM